MIVLTNTAKKELKMVNHNIKETQIRVIANPLRKSDDAKNISSLDNRNIVFVGRLSFEKGLCVCCIYGKVYLSNFMIIRF